MPASYETELYRRIRKHLDGVRAVDCHEHLMRETELPRRQQLEKGAVGRLFAHYTVSDLITCGGDAAAVNKACDVASDLDAKARWKIIKPWYAKAWNTAYCEAIRLSLRGLWGIEDVTDGTLDAITAAMCRNVKPGWTREVFDKAGVDFAMNNPFGPKLIFNGDFDPGCFIVDMVESFGVPNPVAIEEFSRETGVEIFTLDDYLAAIDVYFERYAPVASALKCGRAYGRILSFPETPRADAERIFLRARPYTDRPNMDEALVLENFIIHYLCRKCGEHGLRFKFHTGFQAGNGAIIMNSRAALLANLFMKFPKTQFDMYHISWPYQEELVTIVKNFPNVTADFAWMWIMNPHAGRRALSDLLDAVPASKIHGFGGDYRTVELVHGHAAIARREIARVLAEKVEEGRFTEDYAAKVGTMLLRDNAMENFDLAKRRKAFKKWAASQ